MNIEIRNHDAYVVDAPPSQWWLTVELAGSRQFQPYRHPVLAVAAIPVQATRCLLTALTRRRYARQCRHEAE